MELRKYQKEAKAAIQTEWAQGARRTLLVLPTGTGKTIVFCKLAEDRVRDGERVLILAHRGELLDQAADKMRQATGLACAVEKAEQTSLGSWERIVVGSVQSMMRETRLRKFKKDHFDAIIVDEAHHVLSNSYQAILDHFSEANVLGVTATPDRGDMRELGEYFDTLAYEYRIETAIKEGYLSPIKAQTIPLQLDLTAVKQQAGDFSTRDIGTALDPYLEQIAHEMAQVCKDRKTVVFLPLIETSKKMTRYLIAEGFNAAEVNGQSHDRAEKLADFDRGKYNVLCNSMLLTEGWDCPSVDCIVVLRPTKVRSLYCQMVGRGTRLHPGKTELLLLDFLWMTTRHEISRPAHLICENDELAKAMTQRIEDADGPLDLEVAESMAEVDVLTEREEALAAELAAMRHKKRKLVDPLQYEMSINADDLVNYVPTFGWESGPASKEQLDALEKYGIYPGGIENAGRASKMLDRLQKRRQAGLTTPKQIRVLERYNFKNVGTWDFQDANRVITGIAANGWRQVPSRYLPACDYKPPKRGQAI